MTVRFLTKLQSPQHGAVHFQLRLEAEQRHHGVLGAHQLLRRRRAREMREGRRHDQDQEGGASGGRHRRASTIMSATRSAIRIALSAEPPLRLSQKLQQETR